jgi:hypothetical protein
MIQRQPRRGNVLSRFADVADQLQLRRRSMASFLDTYVAPKKEIAS